jgi:major membrane immunogen (membrane-anchored lipoprotein)
MKLITEMVIAHANANYNDNGWDILIETQNANEVENIIKGAKNLNDAIKKASNWCRLNKEEETSIKNLVW